MQSVMEVHQNIEKMARENSHSEVRVITTMENGQAVRQGDLYITKVESLPAEYTERTNSMKLVDGKTKGSRHVLKKSKSLKVFLNPNANPLQGPGITTEERLLVKHPEHAYMDLVPGNYVVTYQRDYSAEELSRVKD
jgi:hypothetical protein